MDTLSHALIGIAVAGLSGQPMDVGNPVYWAAVIGAQAPDLDIVALLRGNMAFLRQHRAFSHSIPGVAMWSLLVAAGIQFFVPQSAFFSILGWAFSGALSHIMIDYLNTHGTAILWPICRERRSSSLLNVFDPVLLALMLGPYLFGLSATESSAATFVLAAVYIAFRFYLRSRSTFWLKKMFHRQTIIHLLIMPSLKRTLCWDFLIETDTHHYIGVISTLTPLLEIKARLPKQGALSPTAMKAQSTPLGAFFKTFTPYAYFEEQYDTNILRVNIYDLRYFINEQFLHRATIIFNDAKVPLTSYLYSEGRTIKVPC